MRNRTSLAGASIGVRAKQGIRAHQLGLRYLGYSALGFLASNAFVLGGLAPFGVAFAAAAKRKYSAAATLGATIGYLFSADLMGNIKYIAAMLLLFLLRWLTGSGTFLRSARISAQLLAAASLGIPSIAITMLTGGSVYDGALAVSELLLACCAAYFFTRTEQAFELGVENMEQTDVTSLVITFCIVVLALNNLKIGGLSVGRILAVLVILLCAQTAHEAGGAIAGVAAGVSAGMLGGGQVFLMGTYGFGGLLAGVFAPLGRIASAGAFILINTFTVLAGRRTADRGLLIEIFIACAITLFIPQKWLQKCSTHSTGTTAVHGETYKELLTHKIGTVSGALREVAHTTRRVNERLSERTGGDISVVYHTAADRVCRDCKKQTACWQLRYTDTNNVLNDALAVLRRGDSLSETDFPAYFTKTCENLPDLTAQLKLLFSEYAARENTRRKLAQMRGVVTDQFEGMALMIDAMGQDLDELAAQDVTTAGKVREYLQSLTIFPDLIACTVDRQANMTLEMTLPTYKLSRIGIEELTLALSDISGREFGYPAQRDQADAASVMLTFTEKAAYTVRWGAAQLGNSVSKLCGDSFSYIDGSGRVNVILSDGMGSGGAAALDSTMTAELLKRLIEAGVSLDAALRLVNSALLVKAGDESLATIDITGIDLYTGVVEFYKAGAAPTFLRKSGKAGYVETNSLPAGILNGVSFEKIAVTLHDSDWIVMVSDGALAGGYEWLRSDLEHYTGEDPKELSEQLANEAKRRRDDGHEDDITVISIRIERGI